MLINVLMPCIYIHIRKEQFY